MKEFTEILMKYLPEIVSGCASVVVGVLALIQMRINKRLNKEKKSLEQALIDAKVRMTYCICPECKETIYLKDLTFRLPDGSIDQNLDGEAD